jgi:outer membrane protein OmpA-like peptidoglycan-associated protein
VVLDVRYAPNDLKPAPADRQAVDATRQWLEAHANARATVRAFTDAQGDAAHNLALSHARGRWISQHLTGHGVVQSRIHLQAFGEYAPRMDVSPGDKANRRVEVWVSGAPCPGSFQENRP